MAAYAVGGAISVATGALVGRSIANSSSMSYGQAAGAGAAGGLIAGVIGATLVNAEVGKIYPHTPAPDAATAAALKALSAKRTVVNEAQVANPATASQQQTP